MSVIPSMDRIVTTIPLQQYDTPFALPIKIVPYAPFGAGPKVLGGCRCLFGTLSLPLHVHLRLCATRSVGSVTRFIRPVLHLCCGLW